MDYDDDCDKTEPLIGFRFLAKTVYRVFQKFVPIVNCILHIEFNASLGKCKLIQVRNLSKEPFKEISN